jgi:histidine triad (HIT) family protein
MNDCVFCKIVKGEIPTNKIYEDGNFLAILDINPVNPGHSLLMIKNHHKNIYETPDEILCKIGPVLKKISNAVKDGVGADGINIIMNNEEISGQMIPHTHFHVIPRFANDGFRHWLGKPYPNKEETIKITKKIKNSF